MAHWRTMVQAEHFCASDLWDDAKGEYRKAWFKIVKVSQGTIVGQKGRKKGLPFLTLEDLSGKVQRAPFGSNPTNCTTIGAVLGTPDAKHWIGKVIGLYVTKVDSPEGLVDAIRIHPKAYEAPKGEPKSAPPADAPSSGAAPAPTTQSSVSPAMTEEEAREIAMRDRAEAARGQ